MTVLAVAQIPASCLKTTLERSDFLIEDLKTLRGVLQNAQPVPAPLAEAIERHLLSILDEMSPEVAYARAKAQQYFDAPKLGFPEPPMPRAGTGGGL